jgi:rhamnose transport system permease protein
VLTGALLAGTIAIDRMRGRGQAPPPLSEEFDVRNSQVAVLCGAILTGSLIVAGTNVWLVRAVGAGPRSADGRPSPAALHRTVIAVMPKAKGDPYFVSCRAGAEEAARELDVDLVWDGPTGLDAAKQNELVENWITRKVDAIAVAVENRAGISTVLRKARERIHVLTWDADAEPDARDSSSIRRPPRASPTRDRRASRLLGGKGVRDHHRAERREPEDKWIAFIKKRLDKHVGLKLVTIRLATTTGTKAFAETQTLLKVYPSVKLMMAISAGSPRLGRSSAGRRRTSA